MASSLLAGYFPWGIQPDSFVIGWQIGAHKSTLKVVLTQLHRVPRDESLRNAAARFAAYSTAYAVQEGAAKAWYPERLVIRVTELLAEALTNICYSLGVVPDSRPQSSADFVAEYDTTNNLELNGRPVSVQAYTSSGPLHIFKMDEAC